MPRYKLTTLIFTFLFMDMIFMCHVASANNSNYIAISNQLARKRQLQVVANNVANAQTTGYKQDTVLYRNVDYKQNFKRSNSFVWGETTFKSGDTGGIKFTGRTLDLTIAGEGYFKVITPRGPRYTLDGSMKINNQNVLVNSDGFAYTSIDGAIIEIPDEFSTLDFAQDGTIFVDGEEINRIGAYDFPKKDSLVREGGKLQRSTSGEISLQEFEIISGALRDSNVNPTLAMAQMVEMQRSVGATNSMLSDLAEIERSTLNKLMK